MDTALFTDVTSSQAITHCYNKGFKNDKVHIKDIFFDHYDLFLEWDKSGKARPCILDNVQKAILCSSIYMGYDIFQCPHCGSYNFIFRSCHGSLCQKCGAKRSRMLATSFSSIALDVVHRHIVFTIPKELRIFFIKDRSLLHLLFIAARNTIAQLVNKSLFEKLKRQAKKHHRKLQLGTYIFKDEDGANTFGMVATLHTFGRSLQWNPHLHLLIPEIIYNQKKDKVSQFNYFNYDKLRKTFQFELLRLMEEKIGSSFYPVKSKIYDNHGDGFYVYAPPMDYSSDDDQKTISENIQGCINYCLRYAGRTPMAESRIDNYDKENDTVSWWYEDHTTEQRVDVCDSAEDFIKKLIIHCPDPYFKMIRYYGFYANAANEKLNRIHELLGKKNKDTQEKRKAIKQDLLNKLKYRTLSIDTYHRDPIKCPCGCYMEYIDTMDPFGRLVSLSDGVGGEKNDREYRDKCIRKSKMMKVPKKQPHLIC